MSLTLWNDTIKYEALLFLERPSSKREEQAFDYFLQKKKKKCIANGYYAKEIVFLAENLPYLIISVVVSVEISKKHYFRSASQRIIISQYSDFLTKDVLFK